MASPNFFFSFEPKFRMFVAFERVVDVQDIHTGRTYWTRHRQATHGLDMAAKITKHFPDRIKLEENI